MRALVLIPLIFVASGCGGEGITSFGSSEAAFESRDASVNSVPTSISSANSANIPAGAPTSSDAAAASSPVVEREIIYTATIDLVVDDFIISATKIRELANKHDAIIANYQRRKLVGSEQFGDWVLRIPAANFHAMVSAVESLGTANNSDIQGQDISEEYVDLRARLVNQQRFEKELLELLDARQGPLNEVLEIQRELGKVREVVERLEGRLRFLNDRIAYSTITITVRERKIYQDKPPTFATRLHSAWSGSVSLLGRVGENFTVTAVAGLPWVLVALLFIAPPMAIVNLRRRKRVSQNRRRLTESK